MLTSPPQHPTLMSLTTLVTLTALAMTTKMRLVCLLFTWFAANQCFNITQQHPHHQKEFGENQLVCLSLPGPTHSDDIIEVLPQPTASMREKQPNHLVNHANLDTWGEIRRDIMKCEFHGPMSTLRMLLVLPAIEHETAAGYKEASNELTKLVSIDPAKGIHQYNVNYKKIGKQVSWFQNPLMFSTDFLKEYIEKKYKSIPAPGESLHCVSLANNSRSFKIPPHK